MSFKNFFFKSNSKKDLKLSLNLFKLKDSDNIFVSYFCFNNDLFLFSLNNNFSSFHLPPKHSFKTLSL
jgi:hypothetical protein